jgi:hypothetical protein
VFPATTPEAIDAVLRPLTGVHSHTRFERLKAWLECVAGVAVLAMIYFAYTELDKSFAIGAFLVVAGLLTIWLAAMAVFKAYAIVTVDPSSVEYRTPLRLFCWRVAVHDIASIDLDYDQQSRKLRIETRTRATHTLPVLRSMAPFITP